MFNPLKWKSNTKLTAPIKSKNEIPSSSIYAKEQIIYFTSSNLLNEKIGNNGKNTFNTLKNITNKYTYTLNNESKSVVKSYLNINSVKNRYIESRKNNKMTNQTINNIEKLQNYSTIKNNYKKNQDKLKNIHKEIKDISYYRYKKNNETFEKMPMLEKINKELNDVSSATKLYKDFKYKYFRSIVELLIKPHLDKINHQYLDFYKKTYNHVIEYAKRKKYNVSEYETTNLYNRSVQYNNAIVNKNQDEAIKFTEGIKEYFNKKEPEFLALFKARLNTSFNKKEQNEDIQYILSIVSTKYPMIDTAVIVTVYNSKKNNKKKISNYIPRLLKKNTNEVNLNKDIDTINIYIDKKSYDLQQNVRNALLKQNQHGGDI